MKDKTLTQFVPSILLLKLFRRFLADSHVRQHWFFFIKKTSTFVQFNPLVCVINQINNQIRDSFQDKVSRRHFHTSYVSNSLPFSFKSLWMWIADNFQSFFQKRKEQLRRIHCNHHGCLQCTVSIDAIKPGNSPISILTLFKYPAQMRLNNQTPATWRFHFKLFFVEHKKWMENADNCRCKVCLLCCYWNQQNLLHRWLALRSDSSFYQTL